MAKGPSQMDKQRRIVMDLLRARAIQFRPLPHDESLPILDHFVNAFVDRRKRESVNLNLRRPRVRQKPIDYHKYFPPDSVKEGFIATRGGKVGLVQWLPGAPPTPYCYLLHSEPWLPPFEVAGNTYGSQ